MYPFLSFLMTSLHSLLLLLCLRLIRLDQKINNLISLARSLKHQAPTQLVLTNLRFACNESPRLPFCSVVPLFVFDGLHCASKNRYPMLAHRFHFRRFFHCHLCCSPPRLRTFYSISTVLIDLVLSDSRRSALYESVPIGPGNMLS